MKDQISQVDIAYNGDIVISATLNGKSVHWTLSQKRMLELLKSIK